MRINPTTCRDPDLLAAEVRRLQSVIDALADQDNTVTNAEREALEFFGSLDWPPGSQQIKARAVALRSLLKRIGYTPSLHGKPREVSVQNGCTIRANHT